MNIPFIEDARELREIGVAQLEQHNTVYPASNLVDARAIMDNPAMRVHLVAADHRLADGQGIEFVIEMKALFCEAVIETPCDVVEEVKAPIPELVGAVVPKRKKWFGFF